jgi:CO dehydrogenase maturation factor
MNRAGLKRSVILFCGKGGVGKTTLSAMTIQMLCKNREARILAVDADPALGLALTLGISPKRTLDDVLRDLSRDGGPGGKAQAFARLDYDVMTALAEFQNLAFLALGQPESEGCFCAVNSILKQVLARFSEAFDAVVIDAEAGVEQINRRVFDDATHLFVVTDHTRKGFMVAGTVLGLARRCIRFCHAGLIVNRVSDGTMVSLDIPRGFDSSCRIPEDPEIRAFDLDGKAPAALIKTQAAQAMRAYLKNLHLT